MSNIFYHFGRKIRVFQIGNIFSLNHFIFLQGIYVKTQGLEGFLPTTPKRNLKISVYQLLKETKAAITTECHDKCSLFPEFILKASTSQLQVLKTTHFYDKHGKRRKELKKHICNIYLLLQ